MLSARTIGRHGNHIPQIGYFAIPIICLVFLFLGQADAQMGGILADDVRAYSEGDLHLDPADIADKERRLSILGSPQARIVYGQPILDIIPDRYTGTGHSEPIIYQVPTGYQPGIKHTLVVCCHRWNVSAWDPVIHSDVDTECENRNFIFLSIQGNIQNNWGYPIAQTHCTKAIQYMMDPVDGLGLDIDTDRIYMVGCSMGGLFAGNYASRHMGIEEDSKYRIAGVVLTSSVLDFTDTYYNSIPSIQAEMEQLFGGSPVQIPFIYKQHSVLYMESGAHVLNESMGQNLRHNLPVYITYAEDDNHTYLVKQNDEYVDMMVNGAGANVLLKYWTSGQVPNPHGWQPLDLEIQKAFDFVDAYSLNTLDTEAVTLLADRDAMFYWADVTQTAQGSFSKVEGSSDTVSNHLEIAEAANTSILEVDAESTGLNAGKDLTLSWQSSSTTPQKLEVGTVTPEPTYVVDDQGVLYAGYSYNSTVESLSFDADPPIDLDLKASYEPYTLTLTLPTSVPIGQICSYELEGGDAGDFYELLLAFSQKETPIPKNLHLLVDLLPPTVWLPPSTLDGLGEATLNILVLNDPTFVGLVIYNQFFTWDKGVKAISNMAPLEITY